MRKNLDVSNLRIFVFIMMWRVTQQTNTTETNEDSSSGNGKHSAKLIVAITIATLAILALFTSYYFLRYKRKKDSDRPPGTYESNNNKQENPILSISEPLDEIQENQI